MSTLELVIGGIVIFLTVPFLFSGDWVLASFGFLCIIGITYLIFGEDDDMQEM